MSKWSFQTEEQHNKAAEEFAEQLKDLLKHDCDANKKNACHQLAEFYQTIEHDHQTAMELYKINCEERQYMQSCFSLGVCKLLNKDNENPQEALRLFNKACDADVFGACNNAGLIYKDGLPPHIDQDIDKAVKLFTKCCDNDFRNGCFNLSTMYLQGKGGLPKDMEKAFEFSKKSCELGHPWGCINTGVMYTKGEGVEQNMKEGKKYKHLGKKYQGLVPDTGNEDE